MIGRIKRHFLAATISTFVIIGHALAFEVLSPPLFAQQFEVIPGPLVEEPIGPFRGETQVGLTVNLLTPAPAQSTFVVTYNGFTPQAQAAFQSAVDIWASQIQSSVPIRVIANWTPLSPFTLGSARVAFVARNFSGAPFSNVYFPIALANKLSGFDLAPNGEDIVANFNSTLDWYLGTDGKGGAKVDLLTVVLHELGHGLGFVGSMDGSDNTGRWGMSGFPYVYDLFASNGASQSLIDTTLFPNPSPALGAQLLSNNLFVNGTNAQSANGGSPPKLYAPNPWSGGSSYNHLNDTTYPPGSPNSLMTHELSFGEVIHDTGPIVRGMFRDMGWEIVKRRTRGDFDGDGKADVTVYRPSDGIWYILRSGLQYRAFTPVQWGISTDIPVPGDYDGDGAADIAVYRPETGVWHVRYSSSGFSTTAAFQWGIQTDIPSPGDYDGDNKTDFAVYRPETGLWHVLLSRTNFTTYASYQWGTPTDIPVSGDYDGDGKTDFAVYRPETGVWHVLLSRTNFTTYASYQWGIPTDIPAPADYDGDGKTDFAVHRPETGVWHVLLSSANFAAYVSYQWGASGDIPVPSDYDGDGKTDFAVYRPETGFWHVLLSSANFAAYVSYQWGASTDLPVLRTR